MPVKGITKIKYLKYGPGLFVPVYFFAKIISAFNKMHYTTLNYIRNTLFIFVLLVKILTSDYNVLHKNTL